MVSTSTGECVTETVASFQCPHHQAGPHGCLTPCFGYTLKPSFTIPFEIPLYKPHLHPLIPGYSIRDLPTYGTFISLSLVSLCGVILVHQLSVSPVHTYPWPCTSFHYHTRPSEYYCYYCCCCCCCCCCMIFTTSPTHAQVQPRVFVLEWMTD